MGSHTRSGDQNAEALIPGGGGKGSGLVRRAVRGIDVDLKGDLQLLERTKALLNDGQIAVTAQDHANFFHSTSLRIEWAKSAFYFSALVSQ